MMQMTVQSQSGYYLKERAACPYHAFHDNVCRASISSMRTDVHKRGLFCDSENYDNCPLFLSRLIRKR